MKSKHAKRIDKLLGELGLHPHALDPEELAAGLESSATPVRLTGPCGKCCYGSEATARKAATRIKSHGANTSFFRTYFCADCKAWHLTSAKNVGPGHLLSAQAQRRPQSPQSPQSPPTPTHP